MRRTIAVVGLLCVTITLSASVAVAGPFDSFTNAINDIGSGFGELGVSLAALFIVASIVAIFLTALMAAIGWRIGGYEVSDRIKSLLIGISTLGVIFLTAKFVGDQVPELSIVKQFVDVALARAASWIPKP